MNTPENRLNEIFSELYKLFLESIEETKTWVEPPEDYDEGFHDWMDGEIDDWLRTQPTNNQIIKGDSQNAG